MDGYFQGKNPDLFYCERGKLYDRYGFELVEVLKDEIDLSGLEGKYPVSDDRVNKGYS